jgi:serine/threonine protein kinase
MSIEHGQSAELVFIAEKIKEANNPEDLFGLLNDATDKVKAGRTLYFQLSKKVFPDLFISDEDKKIAETAFKKLHFLWETAEAKINDGIYGTFSARIPTFDEITIKTRRREYQVLDQINQGEITNVYRCSFKDGADDCVGSIKMARDPMDNDLIENEARILKQLRDVPKYQDFHSYYPDLLESVSYVDQADKKMRKANIFREYYELYSLTEVKKQYPNGLDPKDMAWIYRRLLVATGFSNKNQIINGAILPPFIFIQPENHGLVLTEWSYAVADPLITDERISAINQAYRQWYPQEVFNKEIPTPSIDILMGARSMIDLLGGDPSSGNLPGSIPDKMQRFFRDCLKPNPSTRPQDAWLMLEKFDHLITDLWGPRKFRPFTMPNRTKSSVFR